jgi:putative hydrolase of the HAD superfamily
MKASDRTSRAVLFDFGGTLDGDGIHWPLRFHQAYVAAGGNLSLAEFEPYFRISEHALAARTDVQTLGFLAAIHAQAQALAHALPEFEQMDLERMAGDLHADAVRAVRRNVPMLRRVSKRYRLAVLSNFTGNLEPCLAELGLRRFFAVVVDSALVGVAKPDPAIFTLVLDELGLEPADAWMVGDNPETDIRPAQTLGLRTAWLAPSARPIPPGLKPTRRIERLTEIEPHLD